MGGRERTREARVAQKRKKIVGISETKLFSIPPTLFSGYHVSGANQYFIAVAHTAPHTPPHPQLSE